MKKAGFVLVIVGMLVASLLLLNMTLTPHVGASSEKITAKQTPPVRGDAVDRGLRQYGQCPAGTTYDDDNGHCWYCQEGWIYDSGYCWYCPPGHFYNGGNCFPNGE
jgi:hypothetical protein